MEIVVKLGDSAGRMISESFHSAILLSYSHLCDVGMILDLAYINHLMTPFLCILDSLSFLLVENFASCCFKLYFPLSRVMLIIFPMFISCVCFFRLRH